MKWLIVAAILAVIFLRIWSAIFPRSAVGRALNEARQRRESLGAMSAMRVLRSGLLFLMFAVVSGALAFSLCLAGGPATWIDLETPFFGALSGGLIAVGILSGLVGIFLMAWGVVKKMSRD